MCMGHTRTRSPHKILMLAVNLLFTYRKKHTQGLIAGTAWRQVLVGRAIKGECDGYMVATKFGAIFGGEKVWAQNMSSSACSCLRCDSGRGSVCRPGML